MELDLHISMCLNGNAAQLNTVISFKKSFIGHTVYNFFLRPVVNFNMCFSQACYPKFYLGGAFCT